MKKLLKLFCEYTTIHGFYHLYYSKGFVLRLLWVAIILTTLTCTIWLCIVSLMHYLKFGIKTSETYTTDSEFQFPAITICNQFPGKRSVLGTNSLIIYALLNLLLSSSTDVNRAFQESQKLCKTDNHSPYENYTSDIISKLTFVQMQNQFTRDSTLSVKRCWWAQKEFDCSGYFANHLTDRGTCFTYIPSNYIARYIKLADSLFYGVNESLVEDRIVRSGSTSGLRLLLNLNQSEHCETGRKYEGAGFQFVVHDPENVVPSFTISSPINLHPGYVQTITLRPTVFIRNTAGLGYCKEPTYTVADKKIYFKNLCMEMCFIKRIISICNCLPQNLFGDVVAAMKQYGNLDVTSRKNCSLNDFKCVQNQQTATYMSENFQINCPECIQPCFETNYEYLISRQKFASNGLIKDRQVLSNAMNHSQINKDFVLANFVFDSLTVIRVVESQDFTIYDLFIYIGGVIGLFLGMSFLTIGEIAQLTVSAIHLVLKRVRNRMRKTTRVVRLHRKRRKTKIKEVNINSLCTKSD